MEKPIASEANTETERDDECLYCKDGCKHCDVRYQPAPTEPAQGAEEEGYSQLVMDLADGRMSADEIEAALAQREAQARLELLQELRDQARPNRREDHDHDISRAYLQGVNQGRREAQGIIDAAIQAEQQRLGEEG